MELAAAEVLAAYREHTAMLLVGGHEPKRLDAAIDALETELIKVRKPSDGEVAGDR